MFRSETIYRTSIFIPKNRVNDTLRLLQQEGICQIDQAETGILAREEAAAEEQIVLNLHARADALIGLLRPYSRSKKIPLLSDLFGRQKRESKRLLLDESMLPTIREFLDMLEAGFHENLGKIHALEEKEALHAYYISNLKELPPMRTSLLMGTEHIFAFVGHIQQGADIAPIEKKAVVLSSNQQKKKMIICICLRKEREEVEGMLHKAGFDALEVPFAEKSSLELIRMMESENMKIAMEKESILDNLHQLHAAGQNELRSFHTALQNEREKIEARQLLRNSDSFALLEAWVPLKCQAKLEKALEKIPHHRTWAERDDAPTLLGNPALIRPFESVTELFSLPKYKEFDPTPVLAITFSFFFAFMLTDAAYGLILLSFGILLLRGKGSSDRKMRDIAIILCSFGTLTLILGIAFGSYFGDLFQQLGFEVPLLIDSLRQVTNVLIISLAIGIVHLLLGLFIGLFEGIRKGQVRNAIQNQGIWMLFVFSLGLYAGGYIAPGNILLAASVVLQIALTFAEAGSISAALSIFSFPGFLGDLFSYARLTALALGTAGIALAVNFMTIMVWGAIPVAGPILAILLFSIGHTFNMAMNGLGAFVHSTRLHFLEFFSRFYEGSGKKYIPFRIKD